MTDPTPPLVPWLARLQAVVDELEKVVNRDNTARIDEKILAAISVLREVDALLTRQQAERDTVLEELRFEERWRERLEAEVASLRADLAQGQAAFDAIQGQRDSLQSALDRRGTTDRPSQPDRSESNMAALLIRQQEEHAEELTDMQAKRDSFRTAYESVAVWKADQQQFLAAAAVAIVCAGYKGEADLLTGIKWMEAELTRLRARLDQQGWQPIGTAPKDWSWFLAFNADDGDFSAFRWRGELAVDDWQPTHWQPLPDPPAAHPPPQETQP